MFSKIARLIENKTIISMVLDKEVIINLVSILEIHVYKKRQMNKTMWVKKKAVSGKN